MLTLTDEAREKLYGEDGPPGDQKRRLCRAPERAPDGTEAHYWRADTGEPTNEPDRVEFTPEQPCPRHRPDLYERPDLSEAAEEAHEAVLEAVDRMDDLYRAARTYRAIHHEPGEPIRSPNSPLMGHRAVAKLRDRLGQVRNKLEDRIDLGQFTPA